MSVGGQLLSSYAANQPTSQASGGSPVHIDTGTAGSGGVNTDANGKAIAQGQPGAFTPTLNANVTTPSASTTIPPPAVVTSDSAEKDVANIGTQLSQAQTDATSQALTKAQAQANALQTSIQNQNNNGQGGNQSQTPSFDDQLSSIISNLDTGNKANDNGASATQDQLLSQEAQNASDQAQQWQNTQDAFQSIRNGTYPLTSAEQSTLDATQQQFQQTIQAQQQANTAYTGQMKEAMASLGIDTSAPTQAIGNIQATVTSGQQKVAALNTAMTLAISTAQVAYQKEAFDELQQSWTDAAQQFDSRQKTLSDMLTTVTAQAKNSQDELQNRTSDALTAVMDSQTISDQDKARAIQQSQLDETTRHDKMQELTDQMNAQKGVYSMTSTGQVLDSRTGKIVAQQQGDAALDPSLIGNTGNAIVDTNTRKTADGVPYIDGTNLTGAVADNAQLVAAQNGIPYLGKDAAAGMQQASSVTKTLEDIKAQLEPLQATDWASRPINSLTNNVETSSQANAVLGAYGTFTAAAIPLLKALANGASGFRITQTELNNVMTKDIPSPNDTVDTAAQKIDNIESMLSNGERGIFGDQNYDRFNPGGAAQDLATWAKQDPANVTAVSTAQQQFPNATPYQISQIVGAQ